MADSVVDEPTFLMLPNYRYVYGSDYTMDLNCLDLIVLSGKPMEKDR